ncbi:ATP-binding protein [Halarcobacter mediterraneus]|uniref:ATP-binding protein n=1 Tax=Halarcobacter mediterraneus TaxID=2023153 RepID=A0A4Q1ASB1_9BACT|nr:HP0729 family protein [Halarcobacter mediterraneus]RXK11955.1 ATP-binding protein [Halarcobacter mediterraneus]
MQNLIILYNPYYQKDVIQQHLKLLIKNEKVAFGKVKSKLKNQEHGFQKQLELIYKDVDEKNYLQLFLTDYSSIYVAKVTKVSNEDYSNLAPTYYREKNLEVETWFIIKDLRELVHNNFQETRDNILANLTAKNFGNHTYAVYGNNYVYPLLVDMKHEIDYFEYDDENFRYYPDMFKSERFLRIKQNLIEYSFGSKYIHYFHPDSLTNIISAQMELQEHKEDLTYDFSSVVIKYSKTIEQEIYSFSKILFKYILEKNPSFENISYSVQGCEYTLSDIFYNKPNFGTYKYLLKNTEICDFIIKHFEKYISYFIQKKFIYYINSVKELRNKIVHEKAATIDEANKLRNKVLGVSEESILVELIKMKLNLIKLNIK